MRKRSFALYLLAALTAVPASAARIAAPVGKAAPTLRPFTLPAVAAPLFRHNGGAGISLPKLDPGILTSVATPNILPSILFTQPRTVKVQDLRQATVTPGKAAAAVKQRVQAAFSALSSAKNLTEKSAELNALFDGSGAPSAAPEERFSADTRRHAERARAVQATDRGLLRSQDIDAGLRVLRAASRPDHPDVRKLIAAIAEQHPELPLRADRVFMIQDAELLKALGLPADAAGAARILTDGVRREKVILINAVKPVSLDDFIEFAIHEAVHLMDEGILGVENDRVLLHWLAEGYTQLRSHEMSRRSLRQLARPARENSAYSKEVTLVEKIIERYGREPLDDLVQNGSLKGLWNALGKRWEFAQQLADLNDHRGSTREKILDAVYAVVMSEQFGDKELAYVTDYFNLAPAESAPAAYEELAFAAAAPGELAKLADDLGAERGLKSNTMTSLDFLDLLRGARARYLARGKSWAPSPAALRSAGVVLTHLIRMIETMLPADAQLNAGIRRALSVWDVFNQEMSRATEQGRLSAIEAEARLFADQVEISVDR